MEREFSNCISKSLSRFQSDHNALIINTQTTNNTTNISTIKFDKG
jgi:hypothetical protein